MGMLLKASCKVPVPLRMRWAAIAILSVSKSVYRSFLQAEADDVAEFFGDASRRLGCPTCLLKGIRPGCVVVHPIRGLLGLALAVLFFHGLMSSLLRFA